MYISAKLYVYEKYDVSIIRTSDKSNFKNEMINNKKVIEETIVKMQILERKLRISEQQKRDFNNLPNEDAKELEQARSTLELKEAEVGEKKQIITGLTAELSEVKADLSIAISKMDVS
ncbi:hypothetical protein EON65_00895 [archaeon]|nr:MAG: hypothetical protein EON65_00895 [archaeon]